MTLDDLMLVTDRTETDVRDRTEKGTYGAADINRVTTAVLRLKAELETTGAVVGGVRDTSVTPGVDWTKSLLDDYARNIQIIRRQLDFPADIPDAPARVYATGIGTNDGLTWEGANTIERILQEADRLLQRRKQTLVACGTATCGGDYF